MPMQLATLPLPLLLSGLLAALPHTGLAAPAHEHGIARLDIGVEARQVTIAFESPLDNLIGFERAPRNDAERRAAEALRARLREAAGLFRFDAAAGCRPTAVEVHSAALEPGAAAAEHADLDASYSFDCAKPPVQLEHALFEAFPRLQRIEARVVTAKRQAKATLVRPARRLVLGP